MARMLSVRSLALLGAIAISPAALRAQGVPVTHCKDGTTTASVGRGACGDHGGVIVARASGGVRHKASAKRATAKAGKSAKVKKGSKAKTKHKSKPKTTVSAAPPQKP